MAQNIAKQTQHLSEDEKELVTSSHFPQLCQWQDNELKQLLSNIRDRRDRARDIASRQKRELRGKAAPSGAQPASGNEGTKEKLAVLSAAVQRVNKEVSRRKVFAARAELVGNAQRALEMRRNSFTRHHPKSGRTADKGMSSLPNERAEDLTNRMEVGRVSQFVKAGQARRDAR